MLVVAEGCEVMEPRVGDPGGGLLGALRRLKLYHADRQQDI